MWNRNCWRGLIVHVGKIQFWSALLKRRNEIPLLHLTPQSKSLRSSIDLFAFIPLFFYRESPPPPLNWSRFSASYQHHHTSRQACRLGNPIRSAAPRCRCFHHVWIRQIPLFDKRMVRLPWFLSYQIVFQSVLSDRLYRFRTKCDWFRCESTRLRTYQLISFDVGVVDYFSPKKIPVWFSLLNLIPRKAISVKS